MGPNDILYTALYVILTNWTENGKLYPSKFWSLELSSYVLMSFKIYKFGQIIFWKI